MGLASKIVICPDDRDTKKLIELIKEVDSPFYKIGGIITTKRNVNLHYKDLLGIEILDGVKIPFYHASEHQQDNMDLYYVEQQYDSENISEEKLQEELKNAKTWFSEEKELFINKNNTIIYLKGERASLRNGLTLFMFDRMAEEEIANLSDNLENLKDFLTEGKIDMQKALPYFMEKIAKEKLDDETLKLLNSVLIIDMDGIDDVDNYFMNSGLFRLRIYR